jgi:diguanylate cyclase (GGDEF)-like protein
MIRSQNKEVSKVIKKLNNYLLEEKLLIYTIIGFLLVSILSIISNVIIGFHHSINYKWYGAIFVALVALSFALKKKNIRFVSIVMTSLILFFFLPVAFITSGGSLLAISYLILIAIMTNYIYAGKLRIFFNTSSVVSFYGLMFIKERYPTIFPAYTHEQHVLDALFQVPIILILSFFMLSFFSDTYRNERNKLKEYSDLLNEKNKELERISITDHLTGLYNRRYVFRLLEDIKKKKESAVLILIDLDNFKQVNDRYGHDAGDQVLLNFSEKIMNAIGDQGIIGRYGGDEFLIILIDMESADGEAIATHILEEIGELTVEEDLTVTASGGVVIFDSEKSIKEVISNADKLLYKVKTSGKNDILMGETN